MDKKHELRQRRHYRLRRRVTGTGERPRLAVFRSLKHIYAQIIDDSRGVTLAAASTMDSDVKAGVKTGGDIEAAKAVGKLVAERGRSNGVSKVVFDRGGFAYHGRIASLADAAREAGLEF
jgi:large subunit ribosomal protein L18